MPWRLLYKLIYMKSQRQVEKDYQNLMRDVATKEFYQIDLTNRRNTYVCDKNSHAIVTIDRHAGVTPMFILCPHCSGRAESKFYNGGIPGVEPSHEWYRPTLKDCLKMRNKNESLLDHVLNGGLVFREIEKPKSMIYMADIKDVKL